MLLSKRSTAEHQQLNSAAKSRRRAEISATASVQGMIRNPPDNVAASGEEKVSGRGPVCVFPNARIFARWIEDPFSAAVQRSHDPGACEHRRAAERSRPRSALPLPLAILERCAPPLVARAEASPRLGMLNRRAKSSGRKTKIGSPTQLRASLFGRYGSVGLRNVIDARVAVVDGEQSGIGRRIHMNGRRI